MRGTTVLVLAKAPVAGAVKTRLAADLGGDKRAHRLAAQLAAAALLDTIEVCAASTARCRIALAGDLEHAVRSAELRRALVGWEVTDQPEGTLAERLAAAHRQVPGPVVQIGMDTPQVTTALLLEIVAGLALHDAVLAPASDGGWWALALRDGRDGGALRGVPMSTPTTYDDTRAALVARGLAVGAGPVLTDVDRRADAHEVAAAAPGGRFAGSVRALLGSASR